MDYVEILGFVAAILTTGSFIPQVLRVQRTRSTRDISLTTFVLFGLGVLGWLIYGVLISSLPVILANGVTLCLAGTIIFFKLKYK